MKLLTLDSISAEGVETLKSSFNNLPHTDHKDGQYRLRRYSAIEIRTEFWNAAQELVVHKLAHKDFTQSSEYNKHQGDLARTFEEIEDETLQSAGFKEMCLLFKNHNNLSDGQELEIHQLRVKVLNNEPTPVAPEGVHQDGYNYIGMIGINRTNITGGELLAYKNKEEEPFIRYELGDGEMLMLKDDILWHNATNIEKKDESKAAYGDWFVICAKE